MASFETRDVDFQMMGFSQEKAKHFAGFNGKRSASHYGIEQRLIAGHAATDFYGMV